MLHFRDPTLAVIGHTLVVYAFLIAGMRLLGRRQMGQLTVLDLVIVLLLGSAVETATVAGQTTLRAGMIAAATLLLANRLLALVLGRSRRLTHLIAGEPVLLIHEGQFVEEHLRRSGMTHADVLEAIRERGFSSPERVRFAVLEVDGAITAVPVEAQTGRGCHDIRTPPPARG
jgi:uncharacterized membrane protein YcaP (DUF421 family)